MTLVLVGKHLYLKRRSILIIICPPYKATAPSLTALLSAKPILSAIEIPNTSVRHDGFVEDSSVGIYIPIHARQISLNKNSIGQGSHFYSGSSQSSLGEINPVESTFHDDSIIQVSSVENSFTSNRFREGSSSQVGVKENSIIDYTAKSSIDQISSSFDDSGVPDTETIAIDYKANGVGWFIDPTPLDKSEFTA